MTILKYNPSFSWLCRLPFLRWCTKSYCPWPTSLQKIAIVIFMVKATALVAPAKASLHVLQVQKKLSKGDTTHWLSKSCKTRDGSFSLLINCSPRDRPRVLAASQRIRPREPGKDSRGHDHISWILLRSPLDWNQLGRGVGRSVKLDYEVDRHNKGMIRTKGKALSREGGNEADSKVHE